MSSNETWKTETEKRFKFVAWHFGKGLRPQVETIRDFITEASLLTPEELQAINGSTESSSAAKPETEQGQCKDCHYLEPYTNDKDGKPRGKCINRMATAYSRIIRGLSQVRTEGCFKPKEDQR